MLASWRLKLEQPIEEVAPAKCCLRKPYGTVRTAAAKEPFLYFEPEGVKLEKRLVPLLHRKALVFCAGYEKYITFRPPHVRRDRSYLVVRFCKDASAASDKRCL